MRYVPINGDDLVLVEQEIKTKKVVQKREKVNHVWIYDRSGSMYYELPGLTKQLIDLSKKLPKGDSLSLGWFSTEGKFNWVFKGFRIVDNADYKSLEKAIKNNSTTIGLTCFSEILADTETVIKDLSVFSKIFSLSFLSDGYPVVSNYSKEISNIHAAIKKIKGKVNTATLIGFGHYYNKDLMQKMSENLGAMLIHSEAITEYSKIILGLVKLTDSTEPKQEVEPPVEEPLAIFTITKQGVVLYGLDEDQKLLVSPQKGKSTKIYYISAEKPNKKSWDKVEISDIDFGDEKDELARAMYSAALVLTQQTKTDVALEVIGKVGDKAVVDQLTNAFTIDEYGSAEETINLGIQDVSSRFSAGRDPNYLPPVDAFCVFELLNMLTEDKQAAFYPYHEKFVYERIGVPSKPKEGYSKFTADKDSKCPFSNLTWHESHLNLSVMTRIPGTIELHEVDDMDPEDMGFSNPYPTFVFRNYTFVKDGRVNTKKFFITSSDETYKFLKNKGLVFEDQFKKTGIYGVDISKVPAVNRQIATGKTSATQLCELALEELKLKGQIKALKWLKKDKYGDEVSEKPEEFNDDQIALLEGNGIQVKRGGAYSPPVDKAEASDKYLAKAFQIKIAKMSSLPTVKKVMDKVASGKGRTASEQLVEAGIDIYESAKISKGKELEWLENTIEDLQKQMKQLRVTLQMIKFSIILGKRWFDEFKSREENTLEIDGVTYTLNLKEEEVDI